MEWVTSKRHMTAEHRLARAVQTLQADVHSSPASSRLNWLPRRFKWTRPFGRKTKSGFCACAITFQTQSTWECILAEGNSLSGKRLYHEAWLCAPSHVKKCTAKLTDCFRLSALCARRVVHTETGVVATYRVHDAFRIDAVSLVTNFKFRTLSVHHPVNSGPCNSEYIPVFVGRKKWGKRSWKKGDNEEEVKG
jgi:hypothetical protein